MRDSLSGEYVYAMKIVELGEWKGVFKTNQSFFLSTRETKLLYRQSDIKSHGFYSVPAADNVKSLRYL